MPHPTVMFRRELVVRYGGYREGAFPEDYDLWLRWLEEGVAFEKVAECLLAWHDPAERLSRRDPRYAVDAFYEHKAQFLARWLERHNPFHPAVWIWGAGRVSRQRAEHLEHYGCRIEGYIDIDPRKIGQRIRGCPVVAPEDAPAAGTAFVVPYVGSRGARRLIEQQLRVQGFRRERDYICAA
jgi:hypothetical protein